MGTIAEAFRTGGIWMYAILGMGLLTLLWLAVQSILGLIGKRLPAALWWIGPSLIVVCGGLGTALGLTEALQALENASPENKQRLLAIGFSLALNTTLFASLLGTLTGLWVSFGTGLSNAFGAESESDWSLGIPAAGFVLTCLATGGVAAWMATGATFSAWNGGLAAVLFLGGVGTSISGLRTGGEDDKSAQLRASDRVTSAAGALFAMLSSALFAMGMEALNMFQALEHVEPENRAELLDRGGDIVLETGMFGVGAVVAIALVGGIVALGAGGDLFSKHLGIDFVTCAVVLLPALGATGYAAYTMQSFMVEFEDAIVSPGEPDDEREPDDDGRDDGGSQDDPPGRLKLKRQ